VRYATQGEASDHSAASGHDPQSLAKRRVLTHCLTLCGKNLNLRDNVQPSGVYMSINLWC